MVSPINRKPDSLLYAGWITMSALSIPIAWGITFLVITQIEKIIGDTILVNGQTHITEDYLASFILFPLLGLLIGLSQYLLLLRYLPKMGWWVATTFLGWTLPIISLQFVFSLFQIGQMNNSMISRAIPFFLMGSLLGLMQWFVLRKNVRNSGWWILANAAGWGLAIAITSGDISNSLAVLTVSLLPPLITCVVLWILLTWSRRID